MGWISHAPGSVTLILRSGSCIRLAAGFTIALLCGAAWQFASQSPGGTPRYEVYNLRGAIPAHYDCTTLAYKPSTFVCLHDINADLVSSEIYHTNHWEAPLVRAMQGWLRASSPDVGLIDVGAHSGVYTLVAATMGHRVLAVEPSPVSARLIHIGATLGGLTRNITLLRNAVGHQRGPATLVWLGENHSEATVTFDPAPKDHTSYPVNVFHLDDLTEVCPFSNAILKVDLGGGEHFAFQRASRLFRYVRITHVILQWTQGGQAKDMNALERHLVDEMIGFFISRGYMARAPDASPLHDFAAWDTWPSHVVFTLHDV